MLKQRIASGICWAGFLLFLLIVGCYSMLTFSDDPYQFAILPRNVNGALGILTSPLLHIRQIHLLQNAAFMLVIFTCMFIAFRRAVIFKTLSIAWLFVGTVVWAMGREAFHFGASGIAFALLAFLLTYSFLQFKISYLILCLGIGALYLSAVPGALSPASSWESHAAGLMIGLFLGFRERREEVSSRAN